MIITVLLYKDCQVHKIIFSFSFIFSKNLLNVITWSPPLIMIVHHRVLSYYSTIRDLTMMNSALYHCMPYICHMIWPLLFWYKKEKFMCSKQNVSILVSIIEIVLARAISLVMYWCYWAQKSVANYPAHIYSPYNYTTYAGALQCMPYCNVMKLQPFQSASALPGKHVAKAQFAATKIVTFLAIDI